MTARDLTGTVVAITGATAGIGRAAARQLVAKGAKVALGGRRAERLDELVAELGADNAVGVVMDVRVPADNARLVDALVPSHDPASSRPPPQTRRRSVVVARAEAVRDFRADGGPPELRGS